MLYILILIFMIVYSKFNNYRIQLFADVIHSRDNFSLIKLNTSSTFHSFCGRYFPIYTSYDSYTIIYDRFSKVESLLFLSSCRRVNVGFILGCQPRPLFGQDTEIGFRLFSCSIFSLTFRLLAQRTHQISNDTTPKESVGIIQNTLVKRLVKIFIIVI